MLRALRRVRFRMTRDRGDPRSPEVIYRCLLLLPDPSLAATRCGVGQMLLLWRLSMGDLVQKGRRPPFCGSE